MEGLFPYGPVACMQLRKVMEWFGNLPNLETQRFWPAMDALASSTRRSTYRLGTAARLCG
jgi:hypothetical protein